MVFVVKPQLIECYAQILDTKLFAGNKMFIDAKEAYFLSFFLKFSNTFGSEIPDNNSCLTGPMIIIRNSRINQYIPTSLIFGYAIFCSCNQENN